MSAHKKAQAAFVSALVLLLLGGVAACASIIQLLEGEHWVAHTREVQAALGDFEFAVSKVEGARSAYLTTGEPALLNQFSAATAELSIELQKIKKLTSDNRVQQDLGSWLGRVTEQRVNLYRQALEAKGTTTGPDDRQRELAQHSPRLLAESAEIMRRMRQEEQNLLITREARVHRVSVITFSILIATLGLAILMFFVHYRLLSSELHAREQAELALRGLSSRLMRVQDDERRRFSRELHDSLGQYLASLKMNLEMLDGRENDAQLAECLKLLDACVAETRTISHLLHPPILDLAGLSTAAKWYVEGFSKRSGIEVMTDIPAPAVERLPAAAELVLFRVLQESLTNIHRHSRSEKAEVSLRISPRTAQLSVRDFGVGIPAEVLERFHEGASTGVGLAGMRERVRELGGRFNIEGGPQGSVVSVSLPIGWEAGQQAVAV